MVKDYIKTAIRNLKRHKRFAFINLAGLAVGFACSLLILLYVGYELSYDRFHSNADRIYRLAVEEVKEGVASRSAMMPGPMGPMLKEKAPEVENVVRLWPREETLVSRGSQGFYEGGVLHADSSIFDVFTFPFVVGRAEQAFNRPDAVILSVSAAHKYFGNDDPLGKTLLLDNEEEVVVTGIVQDVPENAHFTFDFLLPFPSTVYGIPVNEWRLRAFYTYVLLLERSSPAALEAKVSSLARTYMTEGAVSNHFFLQPLSSIHLHSNLDAELDANRVSEVGYIYIFSVVVLLILLIACVNYVNLSTARATDRAREVGMRKTLGARQGQLAWRFLSESVLLSTLSLLLALVLVALFLPAFNHLIGKEIPFSRLHDGIFLGSLVGSVLLVGLIAGSYPAFYLSTLQPVMALKGRVKARGIGVRESLVVLQFAISAGLIIATIVIQNQLQLVQETKLGLENDHVIVISLEQEGLQEQYAALKAALEANPAVVSVTGTGTALTKGTVAFRVQPEGHDEKSRINLLPIAHNFVEAVGIQMVLGRNVSVERPADVNEAILINEAAQQRLGWEAPLGKKILVYGSNRQVVGVVQDFHYASIRHKVEPLILVPRPSAMWSMMVRFQTDDIPAVLASIEHTFLAVSTAYPFVYSFLDQNYDALYRAEQRLGRIFRGFSFLAILIACFGLFGLAAYTVQQRTKEIGVRKVLGASIGNIVLLVSKDFLKLVLLGIVIAMPIAYAAMTRWLEGFAYRVGVGWEVFILSAFLVIVVAALTVSYQAIKAALADPVETLRYE